MTKRLTGRHVRVALPKKLLISVSLNVENLGKVQSILDPDSVFPSNEFHGHFVVSSARFSTIAIVPIIRQVEVEKSDTFRIIRLH